MRDPRRKANWDLRLRCQRRFLGLGFLLSWLPGFEDVAVSGRGMRKEVGAEEPASVREEVKERGSVGHGFLLFKLSAMARALRSSSLFSRILKSSSAKPPCVAAASKRAFASSTHEHDDAGKSSSGFSHCFSNQLYLLSFSRTYVYTHIQAPCRISSSWTVI